MIPRGSEGVAGIAAAIDSSLAPAVAGTPAAADARMASMLVGVVAEEFERAVDVLVTDRHELGQLLLAGRAVLTGPLLALADERLADEAGGSMLVSVLQRRGDADVRALGQVMAELEALARSGTSEPADRDLLDGCWRFIGDYTERRRISVLT